MSTRRSSRPTTVELILDLQREFHPVIFMLDQREFRFWRTVSAAAPTYPCSDVVWSGVNYAVK